MAMQQLYPSGTHGAQLIKYAGVAMPYGIGQDGTGKFTVGGIDIYPTSMQAAVDGELKEIKGPVGVTISLIAPSQFATLSGDGWVGSADGKVDISAIQKGASVTVSDAMLETIGLTSARAAHLRLESFSVQYQNEDVAKISYSIKEYPEIAADPA